MHTLSFNTQLKLTTMHTRTLSFNTQLLEETNYYLYVPILQPFHLKGHTHTHSLSTHNSWKKLTTMHTRTLSFNTQLLEETNYYAHTYTVFQHTTPNYYMHTRMHAHTYAHTHTHTHTQTIETCEAETSGYKPDALHSGWDHKAPLREWMQGTPVALSVPPQKLLAHVQRQEG